MDLINPIVEKYAEQITSPETDLLKAISEKTYGEHVQPHMLSGHVQGRALSFFSQMLRPRFILEIGTFTGYSALCLAEGLAADGELHTIEINPADVVLSRSSFDKSIHKNQIYLHEGRALDIIPSLAFNWDLVFIDADKDNYIAYYEMVVERLRPGGLILADNVLFHGQIFEQPVKGKNARAITAFNEHVAADSRTEQLLLTIRDGLLLIKKKEA